MHSFLKYKVWWNKRVLHTFSFGPQTKNFVVSCWDGLNGTKKKNLSPKQNKKWPIHSPPLLICLKHCENIFRYIWLPIYSNWWVIKSATKYFSFQVEKWEFKSTTKFSMAGHPFTDSAVISHDHNPIAFRKNLKKIDDGLTSKDVHKLCFLCRDFEDVPWKDLSQFKKGVELFSALEKAELLMGDDVSLLLELLEAIKRRDLIKKVKQFWPGASVQKCRLSSYR